MGKSGIWIEFALCAATLIYDVGFAWLHWRKNGRPDNRNFEDRIADVRAMNTYNSYMLAGILVFLAFAASPSDGATTIPTIASYLMLAALFSTAAAVFFIPLGKPNLGVEDTATAKVVWLQTLVCSHWAVVLTVGGITRTVLARIA